MVRRCTGHDCEIKCITSSLVTGKTTGMYGSLLQHAFKTSRSWLPTLAMYIGNGVCSALTASVGHVDWKMIFVVPCTLAEACVCTLAKRLALTGHLGSCTWWTQANGNLSDLPWWLVVWCGFFLMAVGACSQSLQVDVEHLETAPPPPCLLVHYNFGSLCVCEMGDIWTSV